MFTSPIIFLKKGRHRWNEPSAKELIWRKLLWEWTEHSGQVNSPLRMWRGWGIWSADEHTPHRAAVPSGHHALPHFVLPLLKYHLPRESLLNSNANILYALSCLALLHGILRCISSLVYPLHPPKQQHIDSPVLFTTTPGQCLARI